MNSPRPSAGLRWLLLAPASLLLASPLLFAQRAAAPDAATLAKYDLNKNGQLDANEASALDADLAKAAAAPTTGDAAPASGKDVIELSPFQVNAANDKGYYASNTLSGTRINSKLEDLGASITVVTKQQMQDFALLDINDIFLYEANTEGTGNYTDVFIDRNGVAVDNVAGNPNNANRVRGIGPANQAYGNFESSGRVPFDSSSIDALEISRGPNSNIFGLGSGSGTVNAIASQANLTRERSAVEFRVDDLGGFRTVLDLNRPILGRKLAARFIGVYEDAQYVRQPSFSRTNRYTGLVTYKPFKNTTLRGTYERYENYARRPNAILPRDAITYWQQNGRPTWDPSTWTVTRNGVKTVVPFNSNQGTETALLGAGLESGGTGLAARPSIFVDQFGAVNLWMVGRMTGIPAVSAANPNPIPTPDFQAGNPRFVESAPAPRVGPLAPTVVSLTDKSLYDWSETNIAAANWNQDKVNTYTVELEHFFLNTPRHVLAAQLAWRREDAFRYTRSFIGTGGESPMVVYVDVNEKLLDGRTNPYFLRPYVNALEPSIFRAPELRDNYRGQLAYKLNLAQEKNWLRWLGDHTVSGYSEYKERTWANYRFRDVIVDDHAWNPAGTAKATAITAGRAYYRYYLGDNQGQNIEYGSPAWEKLSGTRNLSWYNAALGQWVDEPSVIGEGFVPANSRFINVIKTYGGVTQNHFFNDRIVTTFGLRRDTNLNRNFASTTMLPDGISPDYSSDDTSPNNWFRREGKTKTAGAVVKPLRGWAWLDRRAEQNTGIVRHGYDFLRSLNFHYNQADSFLPAEIAQNLNLKLLPNPSSKGKDFGVSFSLSQKLYLRFNIYDIKQIDSRTGDAGTIATRAGRLDFAFGGNNDQFNLQRQASAWITAGNPTITADQLATQVASAMGVSVDQLAQMNAYRIAETSDVTSKGKEIELNYNPSRAFSLKVTVAEQKTIEA
ncbi:MAG TPA: TonB-dependent receptor, partial [Opitutaceae bacterium]|nr:TonB-dependent receptor [Opitutaceae bacterium]